MKGCFINSDKVDRLFGDMIKHLSKNYLHYEDMGFGRGGKAFAVIYLNVFSYLAFMSENGIFPVSI